MWNRFDDIVDLCFSIACFGMCIYFVTVGDCPIYWIDLVIVGFVFVCCVWSIVKLIKERRK